MPIVYCITYINMTACRGPLNVLDLPALKNTLCIKPLSLYVQLYIPFNACALPFSIVDDAVARRHLMKSLEGDQFRSLFCQMLWRCFIYILSSLAKIPLGENRGEKVLYHEKGL